ncbi:hypothetical protein [Sphingomonas xanthus]|uniref:Uncharacterized protein n=1 Tax=Sphingomonas xanthus TaxID=2594473 RepID=A0A516ISX0_9SPHN|nr:hypothetical protein [Sphingomonas xanthus]QDP19993.1 hypothetical protein FMM02_08510 [Sphingomonas xanthus]
MLSPLILIAAAAPAPILHYVQSNRDGSVSEQISMTRPSVTSVAVYRHGGRCGVPTYVTVSFDPKSGEVASLDTGRVGAKGEQVRSGRFDFDPATRTLSAWADLPSGRVSDSILVPDRPWHLFNYGWATLNAELQSARPRRDFAFGLPWAGSASGSFLQYKGRVRAHFRGYDQHGKQQALLFNLSLEGPEPATGKLLLDASGGHILLAELSVAGHGDSRDFRIELHKVEKGGARAWTRLLRKRDANCPKGR